MLFFLVFLVYVYCLIFFVEKVVFGFLKYCSVWGWNMLQVLVLCGYVLLLFLFFVILCVFRIMGVSLYVCFILYIFCVSECMCENKKESEVQIYIVYQILEDIVGELWLCIFFLGCEFYLFIGYDFQDELYELERMIVLVFLIDESLRVSILKV